MKIILSVFVICLLPFIINSMILVHADQDDFQNGELVIRGEFKQNEFPKPILTYKIYYSISNGTIIDILAKPHDGIYATVNGTNALLEIDIPKNYPVTNIPLDVGGGFYIIVNNTEIVTVWEPTECFYHFSIPVNDVVKVKILFSTYSSLDPYYALDVPDICLSQTIEDHKTKYEMWTNLRGELVFIFSSSIEKLLDYGYLVEPISR